MGYVGDIYIHGLAFLQLCIYAHRVCDTEFLASPSNQAVSIRYISSVVSRGTFPGSVVYSATKGAVDTITGVLSKELGAKQIRVNAINPGLIVTEGTDAAGFTGEGSEFVKQVEAMTPLGRVGQTGDVADVAVFLASDDARWVNGSTLDVAGGARR